jgi:hypothetical protein
MVGIDAENLNILDKKFICPICSFILHDPVQFNTCGHRICQSCFHPHNEYVLLLYFLNTQFFILIYRNIIKCVQCQVETPRNQVI